MTKRNSFASYSQVIAFSDIKDHLPKVSHFQKLSSLLECKMILLCIDFSTDDDVVCEKAHLGAVICNVVDIE